MTADLEVIIIFCGYVPIVYLSTDFQDVSQRRAARAMETVWIASRSLGGSAATFAGINNNLYQPPDGFCCKGLYANSFSTFCPRNPPTLQMMFTAPIHRYKMTPN